MDQSNSDHSSSDGQGSDFHPNSEIHTEGSTTPSGRLQDESVSIEAENRVLDADPHKGRCLIENCNPTRAVEFAHCYPRSLTKESARMTRLEYWWNMKYQTLNLDTRYNIFPVNASLHHMFDKPNKLPSWTLLPMEEVIMKFWNTLKEEDGELCASRGNFPTFSDKLFQYRLITLPKSKLKGCIIAHQHTVTNDDTPSIDHFRLYAYPFHDYPIVESHLRPQFVILEAGRKLKRLPDKYIPGLLTRYPILTQVSDLYESWTAALPKDVLTDKGFNPPSSQEHSEDEDDNKTARGRYKNPRKRFGDDGSPTKHVKRVKDRKSDGGKGGKQQRDAEMEAVVDDEMESRRSWNNSLSLCGETLRDHDEKVGKVSMSQRIPEWLNADPVLASA
ncbi:hypothetical protein V8E55_006715 [Tylopilus felleus]